MRTAKTIACRWLRLRQELIMLLAVVWLFISSSALAQPLDPIVFVPGILGSRLEDDRGVVWGDALASIRRFADLELKDPQHDKLRPTDILNSVGVLGPFRVAQYSGLISTLKELGFREGQTLLVFFYDWRRSNFDTAVKLREFIDAQAALKGRRFNILAHSMGGLVARIYLHQHGGATRVNRFVTLGTPHLGSAEAFWTLLNGMGGLKNFVAGGSTVVERVTYSFASLYEMLPAYKGCCFVGAPGGTPVPIDLLSEVTWGRFPAWPSPALRSPERKTFLAGALSRAAELQRLVALPLPSTVRLFKVGGDLIDTTTRVFLDPVSGSPLRWDRFGGDGTVPLYSASAADQSDTDAAIQKHATIFNDDHVKLRLRRILTPYAQLDNFAFTSVTGWVLAGSDQKPVRFDSLDVAVNETYLSSGQPGAVRVSIKDERGRLIAGVAVQGWLELNPAARVALAFTQSDTAYVAPFIAPAVGGAYRMIVHVPGSGFFEDYVVSIPGG